MDKFWLIFAASTALKLLLVPAYHSTDFEVHRNWMAITHSLPLSKWYSDSTSIWTLDYPPFFAYFEWLLAHVAKLVDPGMLIVNNLNYASTGTIYFQRITVMCTDLVFALGVLSCMKSLQIQARSAQHLTGSILMLVNVGLIFVDHIHFQYNGMLFGMLLLSIAYMLEEKFLKSAFAFAVLLNFKHIFLYVAPVFAIYLLRFYCLDSKFGISKIVVLRKMCALLVVGLLPFLVSFGPFWRQLPQVFSRLFPFKRGLTHAYWAPNFWALYNTADKVAALAFRLPKNQYSSTSGMVQEIEHELLPAITPRITFVLTLLFMMPILIKLSFYTAKSSSKLAFVRSVVLCSGVAFIFGWHVHEKAILMCLIPITLLYLTSSMDAKYCFILSVCGYFSLFPLLFQPDLYFVRYSLFLAYMTFMYAQIRQLHCKSALLAKPQGLCNNVEVAYIFGYGFMPIYDLIVAPWLGLHRSLPFLPLLLTSVYCCIGIIYVLISYYIFTLRDLQFEILIKRSGTSQKPLKTKAKLKKY